MTAQILNCCPLTGHVSRWPTLNYAEYLVFVRNSALITSQNVQS